MADETTLWGIHAGRMSQADSLFQKKKYVALGYADVGNFGKIGSTRDEFKLRFGEVYPDAKPGAIAMRAGQLYRFIHEMKTGDLVIYPSKTDHMVHLGKISGSYEYKKEINSDFPHMRSVDWIKKFPRTEFSQGALYEIGSAITFFQVKNFADEFLAALEEKPFKKPVKRDDTIALVAEGIEETTQDYILKKLEQELKGHPFATFIANLLQIMGYKTRVSPEGPDGGVDIIMHKDELGFEPPIVKVQVKSGSGSVGDPVVSSLYGKVEQNEFGLLITLGSFTNQAKSFARNKSNLRLIDGEELVELILKHYQEFDSRYKGMIPLKRVFIPEVVEEADGD